MNRTVLDDFPKAPTGRTGWPWNVNSMSKTRSVSSEWPRISVVTPSFNQGRFIEETIRSVLLQGYPNLEYFVIDGGSSDETRSVLTRYEPWLAGVYIAPDRGQADAINRGFSHATGELLAWQNSDDTYLPGALWAVARAATESGATDVFYGDKDYVTVDGQLIHTAWSKYPTAENMIPWPCIHSEVTFFRRRVFAHRMLDISFHHYLDFEFLWHLILERRVFQHVPGIRATFRQHAQAKTSSRGHIAQREAFEIYRRVYQHPGVSAGARRRLLEAMRFECENDWGSYRFNDLRAHLMQLVAAAGIAGITPKLATLMILSCAGARAVRRAKHLRDYFKATAR